MLRCVLEAKWCKFFQFCCANLRSGSREWPGFKDVLNFVQGGRGDLILALAPGCMEWQILGIYPFAFFH